MLATGAQDVRSSNDAALHEYCIEVIDEVAAEHNLAGAALRTELTSRLVAARGQRRTLAGAVVAGVTLSVLRQLENRHLLTQVRVKGERRYLLVNYRLAQVVRHLGAPRAAGQPPDADAATYLGAAMAMQSADQPKLAESHAWQALRVAADSDLRLRSDAYSLLGNLAFEGGRLQDAETCYRRAAELSDQAQDQAAVAKLLGAIGRLHARQGRHQAAIEDLVSAVTRLPGDLILQTELAKALRNVGQSQAAAAVFGTVLTIKPDFPEALAGRGEIQAERGNASAAVDDLRLLRQVRPSLSLLPELRSAYALALARSGMAQTAIEEADAALAAANDNGLIFLRAARVVAAVGGSPERAEDLLRRAAEAHDPAPTAAQLSEARQLLDSAQTRPAETYGRPLPAVS
jgi:tetratricopeptide (TPR) repeat protein